MIIDADCHVSPTPEGGVSIGYDELLRRMDRAGVEKALTWLQPPYCRETDAANAYVHQAMAEHPDRILGFGWADPNLGVPEAIETVRRCTEDYGFFGVKLNGAQNSFFIDDPKLAMPVIAAIAETGKVLAFHIGGDAPEHTHPMRLAKIAALYPERRILAVHMGGAAFHDLSRACIEVAEAHPNVTLVASAIRERSALDALDRLGPDRVAFGSDTPFGLMHVQKAMFEALLEDVSADARAAVMGGTIARVLGTKT